MLTLEFLGAKEQLSTLIDSQRMLKSLANCLDTHVETLESFFVGTNNFLTKLGTKAQILKIATIQKFNEVVARLDSLQAAIESAPVLLECVGKEPRLTTLDLGPSNPPTKKPQTFSLWSPKVLNLNHK